jgi:hypothetical protein
MLKPCWLAEWAADYRAGVADRPSTDAPSMIVFGTISRMSTANAEGKEGCRIEEVHGPTTLNPEQSCFPRAAIYKHFKAGSAIRPAYRPIAAGKPLLVLDRPGLRKGPSYKRWYSPINHGYVNAHPA